MNKTYLCVLIVFIILIFSIKYVNIESFDNNKQLIFKQTLEDMKEILDLNNVSFFLCFGTALGAYREKQFIEHDHDIDIAIFDFNIKIEDIIKLFKNNKKFKIVNTYPKNSDKKTEVSFKHKNTGIVLDIFEYTKKNNDYVAYTYNGLCKEKKNSRCEYVWENGFKLNNIKFFNKIYKIPEKQYIISHYGDDWNIVKKYNYFESIDKKFRKNMV